jgi:hypothetical protein
MAAERGISIHSDVVIVHDVLSNIFSMLSLSLFGRQWIRDHRINWVGGILRRFSRGNSVLIGLLGISPQTSSAKKRSEIDRTNMPASSD